VSQISEDAVRLALATVREQLTEEITEAIEKAVREERKATVAYLRDCAHRDAYRNHNRNRAEALWDAANIVESGEHRREEGT